MMFISSLKVILLVIVMSTLGCKSDFNFNGIKLQIDKRKLSNGIEVIFEPNKTFKSISYQVWVRAGSYHEKTGKTGVANLLQKLMYTGSEKKYYEKLAKTGMSFGWETMRDGALYWSVLLPEYLQRTIEADGRRIKNFSFNSDDFNTQKQISIESRLLRIDQDPKSLMKEELLALIYNTHPYGHSEKGKVQDIFKLKKKDIVSYYKRYYRPENIYIIVSGNFDPDETFQWIKKSFENWEVKNKSKKKRKRRIKRQKSEYRKTIKLKTEQDQAYIAYPTVSIRDKDVHAVDILSDLMFRGKGSLVGKSLLNKNIISDYYGFSYTPDQRGHFIFYAKGAPGVSAKKIEENYYKIINSIQLNGISEKKLNAVKNQLVFNYIDNFTSPHKTAKLLGLVNLFLEDLHEVESDFQAYLDVTTEDIKKVANKYFNPNRRSVVILKNAGEKK